MAERLNYHRRPLFGAAAATIAAARLGTIGPAAANPPPGEAMRAQMAAIKPGTDTSFGPLKQIDAGVLSIGYAEVGHLNGRPVILLHGWPYDIHSYVEVAVILAAAGYRVIAPYTRGYGSTRFLSTETIRNGQQSALATDIIELMDAAGIQKAIVAGYD
jgi:alpha-beta hydrolase superfamily lysophospholipase